MKALLEKFHRSVYVNYDLIMFETSDTYMRPLQRRMLKSFNKSSNNYLCFLFAMLQEQADLRRMSRHCIVLQSLQLFPFQTGQSLNTATPNVRDIIANVRLQQLIGFKILVDHLILDEAFFALDGFFNKQYWRILGTENLTPYFCNS